MAKQPYYGPVGIFSTDDAAADQRQIEAEQWEDPLDKEDEFWEKVYSSPDPADPEIFKPGYWAGSGKDLEE